MSAPLILALMSFCFLFFGYLGVPVPFSLLAGVFVGAMLTGVFNVKEISGADASMLTQLGAVVTTLIVSGVGSFIILKVIDMVIGLRVSEEEEREGLDVSLHGERVE